MKADSSHTRVLVYHPSAVRFFIILGLAVLALAGWRLYVAGQHAATRELAALRADRGRLEKELAAARQRGEALQARLAIQQRSAQIDHQAYSTAQGDLNALQDQLAELQEELAFYRGILAPGDGQKGLRIERFKVTFGATPNRYHYQLVLAQVASNSRPVKGVAHLVVEGVQGGKPRRLALQQLAEPSADSIAFGFRYFQTLEGDLVLPEGFIPHSATVKALTAGRHPVSVERTFDWPG